ncbi:MAG TPA: hypothetical protein VF551_08730, partial [Chthoniobacterales bacterium]
MKIHPTALVESGAQLSTNVAIGPYSIIGSGAVIGDESVLQSHVVIEGAVRIGARNVIGHG